MQPIAKSWVLMVSRWRGNRGAIMCGELCTSFPFISSSSLIVFGHRHDSDGTWSLLRLVESIYKYETTIRCQPWCPRFRCSYPVFQNWSLTEVCELISNFRELTPLELKFTSQYTADRRYARFLEWTEGHQVRQLDQYYLCEETAYTVFWLWNRNPNEEILLPNIMPGAAKEIGVSFWVYLILLSVGISVAL